MTHRQPVRLFFNLLHFRQVFIHVDDEPFIVMPFKKMEHFMDDNVLQTG